MNSIVEKYEVERRLGGQKRRKFGDVFLAKSRADGQAVILKLVEKSTAAKVSIAQLISESTFSFDKDECLGLPEILDFAETDNTLFLVKKFQVGEPLDLFWGNLGRKEKYLILSPLFERLFELLDFLHGQHIYHCDLKPSNILVSRSNVGFNVEIIDFGLAIKQPLTVNRDVLFPLGYAAPELLLNQLHLVNKTTDYFSVGIVLYRLFCGNLPFIHPNPSVYTNLQLTYPIERSSKLPDTIFELVAKVTSKPKFNTLPSKTSKQELEHIILTSQQERIQTTQEMLELINDVKPRKILGLF